MCPVCTSSPAQSRIRPPAGLAKQRWLRAGGSLLPPHFLAQPLAASLQLPGATCERRALSGCRRSIYNPGGRLCVLHLGAACHCSAAPAALVQGWLRTGQTGLQPPCCAAELRWWSLGLLGAWGFGNAYIIRWGPAKPLPLRVCRGRKLLAAVAPCKEPGCWGARPLDPTSCTACRVPLPPDGARGLQQPRTAPAELKPRGLDSVNNNTALG